MIISHWKTFLIQAFRLQRQRCKQIFISWNQRLSTTSNCSHTSQFHREHFWTSEASWGREVKILHLSMQLCPCCTYFGEFNYFLMCLIDPGSFSLVFQYDFIDVWNFSIHLTTVFTDTGRHFLYVRVSFGERYKQFILRIYVTHFPVSMISIPTSDISKPKFPGHRSFWTWLE